MPVLTLILKSGAMWLNLKFFGGKRNIRRKANAGELSTAETHKIMGIKMPSRKLQKDYVGFDTKHVKKLVL